jgi:hypothetical protein
MVVNEFADDLLEVGRAGRDRQAAPPDRAVELADELGAAMASGDVARWLQAATAASSSSSSSLSGTPKGRGRVVTWEAVQQFDVREHQRTSTGYEVPRSCHLVTWPDPLAQRDSSHGSGKARSLEGET